MLTGTRPGKQGPADSKIIVRADISPDSRFKSDISPDISPDISLFSLLNFFIRQLDHQENGRWNLGCAGDFFYQTHGHTENTFNHIKQRSRIKGRNELKVKLALITQGEAVIPRQ